MRRKALILSLAVAVVLLLMTRGAPAEAGPPFDFSIAVDTSKETMLEGMVA